MTYRRLESLESRLTATLNAAEVDFKDLTKALESLNNERDRIDNHLTEITGIRDELAELLGEMEEP